MITRKVIRSGVGIAVIPFSGDPTRALSTQSRITNAINQALQYGVGVSDSEMRRVIRGAIRSSDIGS